jgi:hypothetical protein
VCDYRKFTVAGYASKEVIIMYPTLPFGPFTIPTGPIIILIAATIGLELAGRYGRRLGLAIDDVWNTGLLTILAGLIVARLWNVIQFWPIYIAEPWLIVSVRPSGFVLLPGLIAGLVTAFGYLLHRALPPLPVGAALAVGTISALAVIQSGALLTGDLLGLQSDLPWAVNYYGELRHPVALYYGGGLALLVALLWWRSTTVSPMRIILFLMLGGGIIYLVAGAFEYDAPLFIGLRTKQLIGLTVALLATLQLASRFPTTEQHGAEEGT